MIRNARKIYAFEPLKDTFEILRQNIALNGLNDIVEAHNIALGVSEGRASIKNRPIDNCGGTEIKADERGELTIKSLDGIQSAIKEKIDFVKIDVEGFEAQVLLGARDFLAKHKPVMVIEIHAHNFSESSEALESVGYEIIEAVSDYDFICVAK